MLITCFKRMLFYAVQFYVVGILVTVLLSHLPGSPFEHIEQLPAAIRIKLEQSVGLGDSLWWQILKTVKALSLMRFGPSLSYPSFDAGAIALQAWPISIAIGTISLAFALPAAVILAIQYALHGIHFRDRLLLSLAVALPIFAKLYFLVSVHLVTPMETLAWRGFWSGLLLCIAPTAQIALLLQRILRQHMLSAPYRYAISCGVAPKTALYRVALRPSLAQLVRFIVPITVALLTGSSILEQELMIPGLGRWFVDAVSMRDAPMVLAVAALFCLTLLMLSAAGELLQAILAPEQRWLQHKKAKQPVLQPALTTQGRAT